MEQVSFYIPCFNAEKYLAECIESILNQTYPLKEVLVIDDGSTDNSVSIASGYPVRVVRKEKNQGLAAARNTAIDESSGDFIASCDSDVSLEPGWLENIMSHFLDINVAGAGGKLLERNKERLPDRWRSLNMIQHWGDKKVVNPRFLYGANTVFRKDVFTAVGKYNELYRTNKEDSDLCLRVKKAGKKIIYEPAAIAEHIRTDTIQSILNTYYGWKRYGYMDSNSFYRDFNKLWGKINFSVNICYDMILSDISQELLDLLYPAVLIMFRFPLRDIKECETNKNELTISTVLIKNILSENPAIPEQIKEKILKDIIDLLPQEEKKQIDLFTYKTDKNSFINKMKENFSEFNVNFISKLYDLIKERTLKMPALMASHKGMLNKKDKIKSFIQNKSSTSKNFPLWEKLRMTGERSYRKLKHLSYSLLKEPSCHESEYFWELVKKSSEL